tara:strand:- start:2954 stop:3130 length:177 start_codon:yes stop_codon:yes gene_type:complete
MTTAQANQLAIEIREIVHIARELENNSEQGTLTAGNSRLPFIKIENLIKSVRRELPQF